MSEVICESIENKPHSILQWLHELHPKTKEGYISVERVQTIPELYAFNAEKVCMVYYVDPEQTGRTVVIRARILHDNLDHDNELNYNYRLALTLHYVPVTVPRDPNVEMTSAVLKGWIERKPVPSESTPIDWMFAMTWAARMSLLQLDSTNELFLHCIQDEVYRTVTRHSPDLSHQDAWFFCSEKMIRVSEGMLHLLDPCLIVGSLNLFKDTDIPFDTNEKIIKEMWFWAFASRIHDLRLKTLRQSERQQFASFLVDWKFVHEQEQAASEAKTSVKRSSNAETPSAAAEETISQKRPRPEKVVQINQELVIGVDKFLKFTPLCIRNLVERWRSGNHHLSYNERQVLLLFIKRLVSNDLDYQRFLWYEVAHKDPAYARFTPTYDKFYGYKFSDVPGLIMGKTIEMAHAVGCKKTAERKLCPYVVYGQELPDIESLVPFMHGKCKQDFETVHGIRYNSITEEWLNSTHYAIASLQGNPESRDWCLIS